MSSRFYGTASDFHGRNSLDSHKRFDPTNCSMRVFDELSFWGISDRYLLLQARRSVSMALGFQRKVRRFMLALLRDASMAPGAQLSGGFAALRPQPPVGYDLSHLLFDSEIHLRKKHCRASQQCHPACEWWSIFCFEHPRGT